MCVCVSVLKFAVAYGSLKCVDVAKDLYMHTCRCRYVDAVAIDVDVNIYLQILKHRYVLQNVHVWMCRLRCRWECKYVVKNVQM